MLTQKHICGTFIMFPRKHNLIETRRYYMKIFYFTGTGNSLYVAKRLGGELYSIPQILKNNDTYFEDDKIGIVCPTYGLSIPNIVKEFVEKVTLKSPYIFIIMTCGNNNGNAAKYMSSLIEKKGSKVSYASYLPMISNHIPMSNIEAEKTIDKHIDDNIRLILSDISSQKNHINNGMIVGSIIRNLVKIVHKIHPMDGSLNFTVNDDCIKCRTCAKVCPRNNISINSSSGVSFANHCESCLACVNNCPQKAIQVRNDKNPDARYRNKNITLKEIINANNLQ